MHQPLLYSVILSTKERIIIKAPHFVFFLNKCLFWSFGGTLKAKKNQNVCTLIYLHLKVVIVEKH